jgi:hypothetical protein
MNKSEEPDFKVKPPTIEWVNSYVSDNFPAKRLILFPIILIGVVILIEYLCFR